MKLMLPKMHFELEKWKFNKEYGIWVSNLGNFKDKYKNPIPKKIYEANGYYSVKTACGNKLAHRIVMYTWCPIADREAFTVDHIDHNKRNCRVSNLEWVTREENIIRAKNDIVKAQPSMIESAGTDTNDRDVTFTLALSRYPKNSDIIKFVTKYKISSKTIFINDKGFIGTVREAYTWLKDNEPTFDGKQTLEYFIGRFIKNVSKDESYFNNTWKVRDLV